MKLPLRICFLNLNTLPVLFKFKSTPISHNEAFFFFFFISFHFSHGLIKIHNFPLNHLKESAIHRNCWYNLKDYILERICKQSNCLKSIYSINYRYFKFRKFALESAWGSRHVFTPVTSLTHIDFLVGLPCARSACFLTKLAVHLYWNFDLISEKNSSSV